MSTAVLIAILALLGAIISGAIALYGQVWSHRHAEEREAHATLLRYREPLISAAFDLQSRLYNILQQRFLEAYLSEETDEHLRTVALESTLFVFAQYFGWREILRQDIQFLGSNDQSATRQVNGLLGDITRTFARDPTRVLPFRLWKPEQRAIGELMVTDQAGVKTCMGYSKFVQARHEDLVQWLEPVERDLLSLAAGLSDGSRLRDIQHQLCELIRALDPEKIRYPEPDLQLA